MTREKFIKKWLGNPNKPYTEQFRDEMRDDLDIMQKEIWNDAINKTVDLFNSFIKITSDDILKLKK